MARHVYPKAFEYAWKTTSSFYNRTDGKLSIEQLKLFDVILKAYLNGYRKIDIKFQEEIDISEFKR